MLKIDPEKSVIIGPAGSLEILPEDEVARKFLMLIMGECEGLGGAKSAREFGYSKQRYSQLLQDFRSGGSIALKDQKRGPKTNYRRTGEVVQQIIRHRFLDPDASPAVIAQKLRQCGWEISQRSVERTITEYGLQKKTSQVSA